LTHTKQRMQPARPAHPTNTASSCLAGGRPASETGMKKDCKHSRDMHQGCHQHPVHQGCHQTVLHRTRGAAEQLSPFLRKIVQTHPPHQTSPCTHRPAPAALPLVPHSKPTPTPAPAASSRPRLADLSWLVR
jgi:hypothetical protein